MLTIACLSLIFTSDGIAPFSLPAQLSCLSRLRLRWNEDDPGIVPILAEGLRQMVTLQELRVFGCYYTSAQDFIALISIMPALSSLRTLCIREYDAQPTEDDPPDVAGARAVKKALASLRRQCPLLEIVLE